MTFRKLQAAIEKNGLTGFTASKLPSDRSVSANLVKTSYGDRVGEGRLVSLVAYVATMKRGGKESVNCNVTKPTELLDFPIVLVSAPDGGECSSVTADAIPHCRPKVWDAARIRTPDVPMRFTGQMFLDSSHRPCRDGKGVPGNLSRFTSWEIHPVCGIDVCRFSSEDEVQGNDEGAWTPLDQWEEPGDND